MASTFLRATINEINNVGDAPWFILQPPTGSGKTQGTCLFAAMQADANAAQPTLNPVGVMVVTRLITQADQMAKDINEHAGRPVAVAHHSDSRATAQELHDRDILIITHQAYVNAAEGLSGEDVPGSRLLTWRGGKRRLTIIDEALANVVENNKVEAADLALALACVPLELRRAYPEQLEMLKSLEECLKDHADPQSRPDARAIRMLWDDSAPIWVPDTRALREAMRQLPYDVTVLKEESGDRRNKIAKRIDETLKAAQAVLQQWAFYAQKGAEHSINSASFLIPRDIPGAVVLDATARTNFLWDLFGPRAQIVPTPSNARNYSTATLHVARASGVGKHNMIAKAGTRFPRLFAALEAELGPDRSVFLCTHKANEHHAQSLAHHFAHLDVGHWGAVDGRNDWKDCDTAVIFGLPYLDRVWSTSMFLALQGPQDHDWLETPAWEEHQNVRAIMEQRQLSAAIIQAINRVRVRSVIDARGRSLPADIYIVLPKNKTGDDILADIQADMPKLRIAHWDFEMDGAKVKRARKSSIREALLTFMKNRLPGETPLSKVQRELHLSATQLKNLKADLRDRAHATTAALTELGIDYVARGAGRGAKTYLVKHAA